MNEPQRVSVRLGGILQFTAVVDPDRGVHVDHTGSGIEVRVTPAPASVHLDDEDAHYRTVRDRIINLGFDYPDKWRAWAVGNTVRNEWVSQTGTLPKKRLFAKTSGIGSHCFAIYPPSFFDDVDRIIRLMLKSPQAWLPFGEDETEDEPSFIDGTTV